MQRFGAVCSLSLLSAAGSEKLTPPNYRRRLRLSLNLTHLYLFLSRGQNGFRPCVLLHTRQPLSFGHPESSLSFFLIWRWRQKKERNCWMHDQTYRALGSSEILICNNSARPAIERSRKREKWRQHLNSATRGMLTTISPSNGQWVSCLLFTSTHM